MKQDIELNYQTDKLDMSTTLLESIVKNLADRIGRMRTNINFFNLAQKNAYLLSEQRYWERRDQPELISESDSQGKAEPEEGPNAARTAKKKKAEEVLDRREIPVSFEMSILLREKYMGRLQEIGKRLDVRFMVVPNKVKIMGWKSDLVDDAEEQFGHIQDKIRFVPVAEYGQEIYNSTIFKRLLKQHDIQIVKVLNKYYCWFEEGCHDPAVIIRKIFTSTKHVSIPLHHLKHDYRTQASTEPADILHGELCLKQPHSSIILELLSKIKATIFQKYVDREINRLNQREERRVELSEDKKSLILHLDAQQQIAIQQKAIEQLFCAFAYTFLVFNQEVETEEIDNFLREASLPKQSFKKNKESLPPLFFFERIQKFVCLGILQQNGKKKQEELTEQHPLVNLLNQMPEQMVNFKIAVQSILDNPEQDPEFKKFCFQKDFVEKVTYISLKNPSRSNSERLIQIYIQNKFIQQYQYKKEELNKAKIDVSYSVDIDMSQPVDQTSLINYTVNQSVVLPQAEESVLEKLLPPELSNNNQSNFRFEGYTFNLLDKAQYKEKRYTDKVNITKRREISFKDPQYEKEINSQGKSKFKLYQINIPLKHKQISVEAEVRQVLDARPQLANYDRWVTVFYGGKESKDSTSIYDEGVFLKVLRMGQNKIIREGYLLRTNVVLLFLEFQQKGTVEIPYGRYEALLYVKKIE